MSNNGRFQTCDDLDPLEQHYVEAYTGPIYKLVNDFLLGIDTIDTYHTIPQSLFIKLLYNLIVPYTNDPILVVSRLNYNIAKPIFNSERDNIRWFRHIMFNYASALYSGILKCPKQRNDAIVYRGVQNHYLNEDPNKTYYITTFTSTSTDKNTAESFKRKNHNSIIYIMIITPGVSCIYIGDVEDELLINPYQCYVFIAREGNICYYNILPSNISLPEKYDDFIEFKEALSQQSIRMDGGETILWTKHTRKNRASRIRQTKTTRNVRKEKQRAARKSFQDRMNLPIGTSSVGIPLTDAMRESVERTRAKFNL